MELSLSSSIFQQLKSTKCSAPSRAFRRGQKTHKMGKHLFPLLLCFAHSRNQGCVFPFESESFGGQRRSEPAAVLVLHVDALLLHDGRVAYLRLAAVGRAAL